MLDATYNIDSAHKSGLSTKVANSRLRYSCFQSETGDAALCSAYRLAAPPHHPTSRVLLPASIGRSAISHCADRFGKGSFLEVRTGGSGDPQYNTDTGYKKTLGKSVADTTLIYSNMVRLPGHIAHPLPLRRWVMPCGGSHLHQPVRYRATEDVHKAVP
jgi:hypothetical protein